MLAILNKLLRVFADENSNMAIRKMVFQYSRHGQSKNDIPNPVGPDYQYPECFFVQSMRKLMDFPIKYTDRWGELQKADR